MSCWAFEITRMLRGRDLERWRRQRGTSRFQAGCNRDSISLAFTGMMQTAAKLQMQRT